MMSVELKPEQKSAIAEMKLEIMRRNNKQTATKNAAKESETQSKEAEAEAEQQAQVLFDTCPAALVWKTACSKVALLLSYAQPHRATQAAKNTTASRARAWL